MTSRALHEAIDYASHERLRMTLKAICEKSAIVRELVGHELMVDSRSSSEEPIFHASSATSFPSVLPMTAMLGGANGVAPSRKRPSVQFVECTRCNRKFETASDSPSECVWHDGPLAVDFNHEVWTDCILKASFGDVAVAGATPTAAAEDLINNEKVPSKE
ncbi:hypothetical protein BFW01_g11918 [Lasiodiplodia theobromae]|nr:hypothetical protein BFW01_g11918 [Lasiodiplodia theobromae]